MKTHSLTLPEDLHAQLRAEAAVLRLSLGDTIRLLLAAALGHEAEPAGPDAADELGTASVGPVCP